MTQSKLRFETDSLSPFSLKVYSSTNVFENDDITILRKNFQQLLSHPLAGFQFLDDLENMADQCKNIFEQFRHKKYFVHVGMGGSVLAAEVLKDALGNNNSKVIFINNLDSDYIKNTLESISLKESLFYIVSKSGNTLETQLTMNLIISSLQNISEFSKLSKEELLKNFFVVATDDSQGPLRKMAQTYGIRSLSIPSNLGGRYCALSAVTFLPMLFLGLNLKEFIQGAKQTKQYFKDNEVAQDLLPLAKLFMEEHDSGSIQVMGKEIDDLDADELDELRTEIGFLFQGSALYDSMSVRENLEFPLRRHTKKFGKITDAEPLVLEALESVGLQKAIDLMPDELSGGMKRRIALARTLILKPKIILYDEPTTGLDPITSKEIVQLMQSVQEQYKTSSIIITHDVDCARAISNRMILLIDGKNYAEGTFEYLQACTDPQIQAFFK